MATTANNSSTSVGTGTKLAALIISIAIPLTASSMQAGRFFQNLGEGSDSYVMLFTACSIIFSSVILGTLAGLCWARGIIGGFLLAGFVWIGITTFSTTTSTMAILNSFGNRIEVQVSGHSGNLAIDGQIKSNMATIAGLQKQIDARDPVMWATKREKWAKQIKSIGEQNMSLMQMQSSAREAGTGSPVAQTLKKLEKYGITQTGIAILAAALLDAIPFTASVLLSLLVNGRREYAEQEQEFEIPVEVPRAKKSPANLSAVRIHA